MSNTSSHYNQANRAMTCYKPWLRFITFMTNGFYQGGTKFNWRRIMCWFDQHYYRALEGNTSYNPNLEKDKWIGYGIYLHCNACNKKELFFQFDTLTKEFEKALKEIVKW